MSRALRLSDGHLMPTVGLGTYSSEPGEVERAVEDAIDVGYRHFDCAWIYGNEAEVGAGIRRKIDEGAVRRRDLFVTSKLWNNFHSRSRVVPMLRESLNQLQLDYVDLYLIHWPLGFKETAKTLPLTEGKAAYSDVDYVETWQGMEECVRLGLARSIGLSNFNSEQIDRILQTAAIRPVVNQVEVNPYLSQKKLIKFCKERDIAITAYCPLGRSHLSGMPGFPDPTVQDPEIKEIGTKHNKTSAQVVLNYLINRGIAVIAKSVTKLRIVENIDVYDFALDPEDVEYLESCNKNLRVCPLDGFIDHKYYPFRLEY